MELSLQIIAGCIVLWTLHRIYVLSYRCLRTYVNRKLDDRFQDYHHWDIEHIQDRLDKLEGPESASKSMKSIRHVK